MKEMCRSGRHIRTADNHPMNGRGHRACRPCEIERTSTPEAREAIRNWQKAQQERTAPNAVNKYKPWDDQDDGLVWSLRNAGVTHADIAMITGRTYQAIRKRVGQLISA